MLLFFIVVAAAGAGLAYVSPWLPMLLLGIFLFLATLVYVIVSSGVWIALGYAALSVLIFELSYIIAGFLFDRAERPAAMSGFAKRNERVQSKERL